MICPYMIRPFTTCVAAVLFAGSLFAAAETAPQDKTIQVNVGQGRILDLSSDVHRIALADPAIAEAIVISSREVLINGKLPGESSLYVWAEGARTVYDVHVRPSDVRLDAIRQELNTEFGANQVKLTVQGETVFLRGLAPDLIASDRAAAIAGSLGKVVNLLQVAVPPGDKQILLRVKFASLDRVALTELGANFFTNGIGKTVGSVTTQQFNGPQVQGGAKPSFSLSDALNIFLFRSDLNLGATIKALESRRLLEVLAEPNVLATDGKTASFLSGGEFPYPVVQSGGSGLNTVTIMFREFGVRLKFVPTVTARGTIKLQVSPEVSALDYANGLSYQGFQVPAISIRKVQTEIELQNGQSFAIAGLLDNRAIETLSKVPGLGDIPFFGKLFHSRSVQHDNSELLVMVTPEIVDPLPAAQPLPELKMPVPFMKDGDRVVPGTPQPISARMPARETMPVEAARASVKNLVGAAGEVK